MTPSERGCADQEDLVVPCGYGSSVSPAEEIAAGDGVGGQSGGVGGSGVRAGACRDRW